MAMLVAGLLVGSASDAIPQRQPGRVDGYWLLAADFHVHAFPGDGALAPWELRDEAARSGLDAIAVTDHNQVLAGRLASWVARWPGGPMLIPGEEVTTPTYHLIAIGVDELIDPHQPSRSAIAAVHSQGGVAIAAHPAGRYVGYDSVAMATVDGTEAAHVAEDPAWAEAFVDFWRQARRMNPQAAPIGSSDFHSSPLLGSNRTYVFARAVTPAGVLEAIRHGRTVASDSEGRLYGDPAFIALVQRARPAGRSDPHPVWRRVSLFLVWIGVVGVLVLGPGARLPGSR
jgi:hypothetical protein